VETPDVTVSRHHAREAMRGERREAMPMEMPMAVPMEWKLEVVPVPVTDVDRARRFYSEGAGFAVDLDTEVGGGTRVVQLTPPGSGCSIQLKTGTAGPPAGSLQGLLLVVPDVAAARAELERRGVAVSPVQHYEDSGALADGPGGRWNSFVFFDDPDGNGWAVQERPAGG
jgi:catechol 2,3-dioxygenase-like lactoylglutathione lyase family enzyme